MPAFVAIRSSRLMPGFRGDARRDDDDVRAGRVRVVVGAGDARVVADDRGRLGEVEPLALRQALDDVDQDDVGQAGLGDPLRGRGADVPGADDGDLAAGHAWLLPRFAWDGRATGAWSVRIAAGIAGLGPVVRPRTSAAGGRVLVDGRSGRPRGPPRSRRRRTSRSWRRTSRRACGAPAVVRRRVGPRVARDAGPRPGRPGPRPGPRPGRSGPRPSRRPRARR